MIMRSNLRSGADIAYKSSGQAVKTVYSGVKNMVTWCIATKFKCLVSGVAIVGAGFAAIRAFYPSANQNLESKIEYWATTSALPFLNNTALPMVYKNDAITPVGGFVIGMLVMKVLHMAGNALYLRLYPESNLNTIKGELGSTKTSLATVTRERDAARANLATVTGDLDTAKANLSTVTGELGSTKANLATVTGELDTAKANLATVTGERDTARVNLSTATWELNTVNENRAILQKQRDQAEAELNKSVKQYTQKLSSLNAQLGSAQTELAAAQAK